MLPKKQSTEVQGQLQTSRLACANNRRELTFVQRVLRDSRTAVAPHDQITTLCPDQRPLVNKADYAFNDFFWMIHVEQNAVG